MNNTEQMTASSVEVWSGKDRGDENFPVGSILIRKALRPHIHAYYTFARNADDIADSSALTPADKIARPNPSLTPAAITPSAGVAKPPVKNSVSTTTTTVPTSTATCLMTLLLAVSSVE